MEALAQEMGTPLFIYDEDHLRSRCREAVEAWQGGAAYATKAFLCMAMARLAWEEGMSLDVSTGGELAVALAAGVPAQSMVLHGNNKSTEELVAAVEAGVGRIVVDSFDEIARLKALLSDRLAGQREADGQRPTGALSLGYSGSSVSSGSSGSSGSSASSAPSGRKPLEASLRVTPGIEAHTHEFVRTGQADSKFGFGLESGQAEQAFQELRSVPGLRLSGLHLHIGSQIFDASFFGRAVEVVAPFVASSGVEELCIGGGLGVPYVEGERAPSMAQWAAAVREAAKKAGLDPEVRLTAEPGRAIVARAGITVYRIGTIKQVPGLRTYVAVDGGMSDNPRPVLYGSGYEAFLPRAPFAARPRQVDVVGKHCESGDFIVRGGFLPDDIRVGDLVATPVSGAYGYSMASNYNKVPRPAVVFVSRGTSRTVVRRETIEDLLRLEA